MPGLVRSAFGDPDLRSPSGFDSGLRPPLRMTRGAEMGCRSWCVRRSELPTCCRPDGFDFGLSPSAQDDTEGREWGAEVGALGVRRSRPAVALRVRLRASPSAQDDTEAEIFARSLGLRRITGVIF